MKLVCMYLYVHLCSSWKIRVILSKELWLKYNFMHEYIYIPTVVIISPVVVRSAGVTNVVELSGLLVVGAVNENILYAHPKDDAPACSLTPFLEITVTLYNAAELRLEIVT